MVYLMSKWQVLLLLLLGLPALAIWPKPQHLQTGSSVVWYSPDVELRFEDELSSIESDSAQQLLSHEFHAVDQVYDIPAGDQEYIRTAFNRLKQDIVEASFVPWKFYSSNTVFEPDSLLSKTELRYVTVYIHPHAITQFNFTEAYHLEASAEGAVSISASSIMGIHHAFTTLAQLFHAHSDGSIYSSCFPVTISDRPRFAHRGLNLDISRNEISPKDVMRTLENMKWAKFNRLHVHATDSQSWPLEIPSLPELARKGAYRSDHIWTSQALQEVQEYGQSVGIEVYLEIDMPGHTASIHHSYPDLITGFNAPLLNYSAAEPPAGQLRLNSTSVHTFLTTLFSDLAPRVSRYSRHLHLGGDEFNTNIYALDPGINSTDKSILQSLLQSFYDTILPHLAAHNLTPIFWQEALLDWNLTLPPQSIIQLWRPDTTTNTTTSSSTLTQILTAGHRALFGAASHWYLDCGTGTFLDPISRSSSSFSSSSPPTTIKPPYLDWCTPYKSWRQIYAYNPLASLPTHLRDSHLIHGGEVHLWAELTDAITLDGKLWPRAAAAGEVLWHGVKGEEGVTEDVMRRLAGLRERFVRRGVAAEVVGMTWCLMNRGGCLA